MPPQYIFPCENCDHSFALVPRQAGQVLACPKCQHQTEAPILGKMKQLELVAGTAPVVPRSTAGHGWKNIIFAAGLALAILGGGAGFGLAKYSESLKTNYDFELDMEEFGYAVDNAPPSQIVGLYQQMDIKKGLGEWYEPNYVRYNKQSAILRPLAYGFYGLAGLGLLGLLSSFAMKS